MLDYQYFKDHYQLIAVDISKQKELDADPRAIQQVEFNRMLKTSSQVCTVLEKSKEKILEFCKGTAKHITGEYKTVNAKVSDSKLNKLKSKVKSKQGTPLRMNDRVFNGNNLPHELLLITKQTTKLRNAFENNMSTDITLSKAQIFKIIQSGGFLGLLLSKIVGPLMKVAAPLAKNFLALLGITAVASAIDGTIQKKMHGGCGATTLIISNEQMNDIMKIVQALEDSNILLKGVTKTIKIETKEQTGGYLNMSLGTLGASLLGNLLTGKGTLRAREGILRDGYGSSNKKSSNSTTSFNKF